MVLQTKVLEPAKCDLADEVISQTVGRHNNHLHTAISKEGLGGCNRRTRLTTAETVIYEETPIWRFIPKILANEGLVMVDFHLLGALIPLGGARGHVQLALLLCGENRAKVIIEELAESTASQRYECIGWRIHDIGVLALHI